MADVHTKEQRSYNMSQIKGKNTKPEMLVRRFLHSNGFRYKLHDKSLPGKPDIVLPKYKTIVFVHGCFWHGHDNCKYYVIPKTRTAWWLNKINANKLKDKHSIDLLNNNNWQVIQIWECDLKANNITKTLTDLFRKIVS